MNRLGIFYFCNNDGIVDDYVEYLLDDILKNVNHLCIVCDGNLTENEKAKLIHYTSDIVMQENVSYDGSAYAEALKNHIGFENLKKWDELLLFNNNFFGPLYPFRLLFESMDEAEADFWGLVNCRDTSNGVIKKYIKSYFLVVRKNMFSNVHFSLFWENVQMNLHSLAEVAFAFEVSFTNFFEDKGFKSAVYADVVYAEEKGGFAAENWSVLKPLDLIEQYNFPIIEKRAFLSQGNFNFNGKKLLNRLKENNTSIYENIWKYFLRVANPVEIKEGFELQYILPDVGQSNYGKVCNVAVFLHLYYEELIDTCLSYISNIPDFIDIYITTTNKKAYEIINTYAKSNNLKKIILLPNRGRDVGALLIGLKNYTKKYDIFCFVHDKRALKGSTKNSGEIFFRALWDNMLHSREYIQNILGVFSDNPNVGLLVPPYPRYTDTYNDKENWWSNNYNNTLMLIEKIGVGCKNISSNFPPLSLGTAFWCRRTALKPLLDYPFEINDFPAEPFPLDETISHAIERSLSFVVQDRGFATGVVECIEFAQKRINRLEQSIKNDSVYSKIYNYSQNRTSYYIYGCGVLSQRITAILNDMNIEIEGYVVTCKQHNPGHFNGKLVYEISELKYNNNKGMIIALNKQNTEEAVSSLNKFGITGFLKLY